MQKLKAECGLGGARLAQLEATLKSTNVLLWNVDNALRAHEARADFGESFVSLAREVYRANDKRASLKKAINELFNSAIIEEKSHSTAC